MKVKVIFLSFIIAVAGLVSIAAFAQQDEDVRGAFMTTRPKVTGKVTGESSGTTRPSRRRPKPAPTPKETVKKKTDRTPSPNPPTKLNTARLGLGLTLFMRDSNGHAIRTDPSHEFRKGDHIRVLIETNADGYLYVFNTTDGGQPVMIYPDPELDEAGNYFQAHVPFDLPSSLAAEERLRWLTFDEHPGDERVYFVFTREPLNAVPIEDDLLTYCRNGKCPWSPGADVWAQIQAEMNAAVKVAKVGGLGTTQTSTEEQAVVRGIGLNRNDPEPSLIMLTASTNKNILVATLDLIHKSASLSGQVTTTGPAN
ncbi:MAG TPA: DUF4384 domain-containing protein [Pyrinomonadaceae bacterium]|nr:DUF4384 domain-containing protein [Pyrinomonadaceae bacterium]